jgi:hypothetical protein
MPWIFSVTPSPTIEMVLITKSKDIKSRIEITTLFKISDTFGFLSGILKNSNMIIRSVKGIINIQYSSLILAFNSLHTSGKYSNIRILAD